MDKFETLERVPINERSWGPLGVYYTPARLPVIGHTRLINS